MKNKFLIGVLMVLSVVLGACEQNVMPLESNTLLEQEIKTRITFESSNDFIRMFCELAEMTPDEQLRWAEKRCTNSLLSNMENCNDSAMINMPSSFRALFDRYLEVQIGDSVLKYRKGELILMFKGKEEKCGEAFVNKLEEQPTTRLVNNTQVGFGKLGVNHQNDCYPIGYKDYYKFKYIHELKSVHVTVNNQRAEALFLTLKLEYKGSSWHEAGESRNAIVNLSGGAGTGYPITVYSFRVNPNAVPFICNNIQKNYDILLGPAYIIQPSSSVCNHWIVTLEGSVTQTMVGYPETKWVDIW